MRTTSLAELVVLFMFGLSQLVLMYFCCHAQVPPSYAWNGSAYLHTYVVYLAAPSLVRRHMNLSRKRLHACLPGYLNSLLIERDVMIQKTCLFYNYFVLNYSVPPFLSLPPPPPTPPKPLLPLFHPLVSTA